MAFTMPLDDTRTKVGRLVARPTNPYPTLYVQPADSVIPNLWDAHDNFGDYQGSYTTWQLTTIKGKGIQTIINTTTGRPWTFLPTPRPGDPHTTRTPAPGRASRSRNNTRGRTRTRRQRQRAQRGQATPARG